MATSVFRSALTIILRVTLAAMVFGGIAALIGDTMTGLVAAAVIIFSAFVYYAIKLSQLARWLDDPQAANFPDASGLWGDVLGRLYQLIKKERNSQNALSEALSKFEQAATALPDGAMMLDRQNNIVWLNPMSERHWGISLAQDRMQTVTHFIRFPEFIDYLAKRSFGEPLNLKIPVKDIAGAPKEMTLTVQLVPYGDDQTLLLSRDVSERERLEVIRRDFVANVSHELRTPITVIAGFLETLTQAGTRKSELFEKSIGHMTSQAVRMQRLVEDLLTLSRLEDSTHRAPQGPVNISELLATLVLDARELSASKHRILVDVSDIWLIGNSGELSSAFGNLISNAVRYTPDHGEITIQWNIEAGIPTFRVRDNGEGIPPEHLPRLTERFYRVDRGRSRERGGTGLGLAIVKHALIRHAARMEIRSSQDAEAHGTEFTIFFPADRICEPMPKPEAVAA